ncbi:Alpha/Beta hydrolase protein [Aspergillus novoparasiticus]|uniref:Alpha/Beta hydrolase protein n=1 Tax=Aspergillus novoparasiticus TaxID=986946 RepID=A0A5N6EJC1_9EURO|nr:Alpha/Beta hydrolase protein [Aspergillus novoparasiticus]
MAPNAEILESSRPDPEFEQACCPNPLGLTLKVANCQSSPPLPSKVPVERLRTVTNVLKAEAREALGGPPPNLTERDIEIPIRDGRSILAYVYAPSQDTVTDALPILVFFHGGGFCIGSRHDDLESNRIIATEAGVIIVSLEYSLAPEYPFPQAIHDGIDALHWVANNPSQVHPSASLQAGLIVAGTSAGGSIANAVVYLNRDLGSPVKVTGQLLSVAPLLPISMVPERYKDDYVSHEQNRDIAPILELTCCFGNAYKPDPTSPLFACAVHPSGHAKIPPTYLQACGLDALRDETFIYERILRQENDIDTRVDLYPGLPHHFWEFFPQLRKHVEKRTDDTVKGIQWLLKNGQA